MRSRSSTTLVLLLAGSWAVASPGAAAAQSGAADRTLRSLDPEAAAATITADDLYHRIGVLAADSMRGRDTPSPELEEAARWIAAEFERIGLEPAGDDGGYLQRYPIRLLVADLEASSVRSSTGAEAPFGEAALPGSFSALTDVDVEAPVLLLFGTVQGADLEALPMEGRIVVYAGDGGRALFPLLRAALGGGAEAVLLASDADDATWREQRDAYLRRARPTVGEPRGGPAVLEVRDAALEGLLGLGVEALRARGADRLRQRELPGLSLTVRQEIEVREEASAPNVVGLLRGGDPALRDETLVYSAHMDHVGVGDPDPSGDSIFNGADDDASGTATVIEVAEAMASLATPPRRSVVFLLVSGEEKGLWGSAYYAENPTVPAEGMVANLNADMVGRNWPDTIVAIGREHSDLGETLARVNAERPDIGMTAIDDLWPEENFYRRSDHFNFARRGVPVLFFFNGTHEDYHRPSDELAKIDTEKTARIGRLLYWLGLEVANADERPRWDPDSYREIVEVEGG